MWSQYGCYRIISNFYRIQHIGCTYTLQADTDFVLYKYSFLNIYICHCKENIGEWMPRYLDRMFYWCVSPCTSHIWTRFVLCYVLSRPANNRFSPYLSGICACKIKPRTKLYFLFMVCHLILRNICIMFASGCWIRLQSTTRIYMWREIREA